MVLKCLLARIFNKSKKSGPHIAQDIATAATPTPASEIFSPSDQLVSQVAVTHSTVPPAERTQATEATLPLNVTFQLNIVLSPSGDGWLPHVSLRQGQAFTTLGPICEGPTAKGPAPLPGSSLSNSPVEFKISATAMPPTRAVDATPDSIPSSIQGLGLFTLGEQFPNRAATTHPASQCMAPIVEVQPCTVPATPTRPPLPLPRSVATPGLAHTMQTLESKEIRTPQQNPGANPPLQIAGPSVGISSFPTILDEASLKKATLQLYEFPRLESRSDETPTPAPRLDHDLGLKVPTDGGLHPGYPSRPPGLGSPFRVQRKSPEKNRDNGPPPRPPRGSTLSFIANMSPTFEPTPFYLQQNFPLRPDLGRAGDVKIDSGAVTVHRISNNGKITYSIEAGGHKYLATGQIGSGGFGYVWYAIQDGKEEVAIKVVDKAGLLGQFVICAEDGQPTTTQLLEGSKSAAQAVKAEYDAFKRITEERSPFLTPLLHAFEDKDNFYFVMKFYPQTLRMRANFGFMHWQLRLVAAELLVAIQHLHRLRIVHLDLKMENVLITPSGHVCLADFGNAYIMDRNLSYEEFHEKRMYGASGTDGYLPPERIEKRGERKGYNFKTDIWTYGVILLELFLTNGGNWYSIYYNQDGTHKFGDDIRIPTCFNEDRRIAFITPGEEIDLVHDLDARDLLLSIFTSRHHTMRPDWESLRCHPFFAPINWKKLENRGYDPMFKACLGNAPLQSVDSGKRAIKRSHPNLPAFQKAVHEQQKFDVALGKVHVDYKCPAKVARDALHGATCRSPRSKVLLGHVCNCDLPADWYKL